MFATSRMAAPPRVRSLSPWRLAAPVLAALVGLAALAPSTAHAALNAYRLDGSTVGVADGQLVRLSAYFTEGADGRPELPPGPCRLTLRFVDGNGVTVAESIVVQPRNRDTYLDYRPAGLRPGERATVRAIVQGERDAYGIAPKVVATVEVIDVATSRTTVASPGNARTFNPQPEPPGDLGTMGAASQQVVRVSATYVGMPSDTGLPPGPCNVMLTIVSGNGSPLVSREVEVAPGQTVSLDFATGPMVPGVRRRMWTKVTTDHVQGFVTTSAEVFDEASGKSSVLFPGDLVQSWGWE